jgi:hypothetical protein
MPITIAHPVIAIPLKRFLLPLSALVVGSMMPDFEFFLRLSSERTIGHTLAGVLTFDLPAGLIIVLLFHCCIKFPLLSLFPKSHRLRLYPVAKKFTLSIKTILLSIAAVILGTLSHIGMDLFTHSDSILVQHIPFLRYPVMTLSFGTVHVYFLLQYLISILGTGVMVFWYIQWYKNALPAVKTIPHGFKGVQSNRIWFSIGMFTLTGGLSWGLINVVHSDPFSLKDTLKCFITASTIAGASSFFLALLTFGIIWHIFIPGHKRIADLDSITAPE